MKKTIILGATGGIAKRVTELLDSHRQEVTLFVRNANRLAKRARENFRVIEGDVLNYDQLKGAIAGHEVVYANLAGDLEKMALNIVRAMKETGAKRIIFISSIGIYDTPLRSVLGPYRKAADVVESSGLDYTILRPTWFTDEEAIDFELTHKGEPEKGSVISQNSLASFIISLLKAPENHVRENLGINKPNS